MTANQLEEDKGYTKGKPDRNGYWTIPIFNKASYQEYGWKYIQNSLTEIVSI